MADEKGGPREGALLSLVLCALVAACGGDRAGSKPAGVGGNLPRIIGAEGRSLGYFHFPRGIDISPTGLLAVTDKTGRVQLFGPDDRPILQWNMPKMDNGTPTSLVFDCSDPTTQTLLVADTHNSRIMRYSLGGALMDTFGDYGGETGKMIYPTDIALDPSGHIFVTEYGEHDRILKFDRDGNFIKQWGGFGEEAGQFQRPLALVFLPPDRIIVLDSCNHRVQTFTSDGELISVWGETGREPGQFSYPYALTLGKDGFLYIAEFGNNRIQCFEPDGKFVGAYGHAGREPGEFGTPWGIATAPNGEIYVADTLNHRLQVLSADQVKSNDHP